jgi:hypothetical protein
VVPRPLNNDPGVFVLTEDLANLRALWAALRLTREAVDELARRRFGVD